MNLLAEINWESFGIVLAILAVLALFFTVLILVVNKFCAVEEDPRIGQVAEKLSGANCGGCGFAGCADFAKALVEGRASVSNCAATSAENKALIGEILGVKAETGEPTVAVVKCAGGLEEAAKRFNYVGNAGCESINQCMGGDKVCSKGCLGGGSCAAVCKFEAVAVKDSVAKTDKNACVSCGACVKKCPKRIIELIPKRAKIYVACSSECRGKDVMTACKVGCIGCGLCAKTCPNGAIEMVNNLPVINYAACTGCLACMNKCPRKIIRAM